MLESAIRDLTYGLRQLKASPGFTIVAVLSLALGIGANTAIFQLVDAIRLKMLPVERPHELTFVDFQRGSMRAGSFSTRSARLTFPQWEQLSKHQQGFQGVLAWSTGRFNLATRGEGRYAEGMFVSGDFFRVLGVKTIIGRTLVPADNDATCSAPAAVISHAFWQREFGSDPNVLDRKVTLSGLSFPIAGVTAQSFFGVEVGIRYDVAVPLCVDQLMAEDHKGRAPVRHAFWLAMIGRLKPGWTVERAHAQIESVSTTITQETLPDIYQPQLAKKYLANKLGVTEAATGISGLRRQYERPLWILMATAGLVLLIACANLANLLLARASVREREIAVRLALGASRWTLIRQLFTESFLLALAGAALGLLLALTMSRALIAFMSTSNNPLFIDLTLDWRLLGVTAAFAIGTCLLFGLLPAFRSTQVEPSSTIRSGGRSLTAGRERFSLRRALVATQVALSLVLLVGALLFVRSLRNLMVTDAGFQSEGLITMGVDFSKVQSSPQQRFAIYHQLHNRIAATPGVIQAAQVGMTPMSGNGWNNSIGPDGTTAHGSGKIGWFNRVGPGYFQTMGTRLIAGREFQDRDTLSAPKVAIVNEALAQKFFSTTDVVGRTFRLESQAGKPEPLFQIVGVVKNSKYFELREEFLPLGFFPIEQDETPSSEASFVVRAAGSPNALMQELKNSVTAVNPSVGMEFRSFSTSLQESLLRERLMAILSGGFAVLAVLLATLGLYGVIAYMVARRRNEIGIRIALGANRRGVIALVMRETLLLLAMGLTAGVLLSLWMGKAAANLLYGLQSNDPVSLAGAVAFLAISALLASYGPARRAAGLEPMRALREE